MTKRAWYFALLAFALGWTLGCASDDYVQPEPMPGDVTDDIEPEAHDLAPLNGPALHCSPWLHIDGAEFSVWGMPGDEVHFSENGLDIAHAFVVPATDADAEGYYTWADVEPYARVCGLGDVPAFDL